MGSYIHDNTQIVFHGTHGHDVENQRAQQHEIHITTLDKNDTLVNWANRNYSLTGFKVSICCDDMQILPGLNSPLRFCAGTINIHPTDHNM